MKIVTITGGNGAKALLPELSKTELNISAVISTLDSGGSSGRLRKEFKTVSAGDLRRGYLALGSNKEPYSIIKYLTKKRFSKQGSLKGHSLGNLILWKLGVANNLESVRKGEKMYGLKDNHHIFPATFEPAHICAKLENGRKVYGETNIDIPKHDKKLEIEEVFLEPQVSTYPECVKEIEGADFIIVGPGDIYSSLMQNFLVKGIPEAIRNSEAKKIYICNTMTKLGETHRFKASDFVKEIEKYMRDNFDYVIINNNTNLEIKKEDDGDEKFHKDFVEIDKENLDKLNAEIVYADVINEEKTNVHNPEKLVATIMEIIEQ